MDYNPNNPLPRQEQEALEKYFKVEEDFMAIQGYSKTRNAQHRRTAMNFIAKYSKCKEFDAFIPYLAMNYFDRYITRHHLPTICGNGIIPLRPDDEVLLAIGCLSLAWKMRKESFSITTFLKERRLEIDRHKILRMELMILNGLNWRMRAVTPFCFVDYFFNLIRADQGFKRRTINEIIVQAQGDIYFARFKPSFIAASAFLAASSFLYPEELSSYKQRIKNDEHFHWDIYRCFKFITDMCKEKKIVMETAEMESKEGPRLRVQAGEPSRSSQPSQPAPNEPPVSSQLSQPAPTEPPMDKPSGSSSSTPHREGKKPMDEPSIPHREGKIPMDEPSIPRRKGKEPVDETSEIQKEPESEQGSQMNFALQWVTNENEDVTFHLTRLLAEPKDVATTGRTHKRECCSVQ